MSHAYLEAEATHSLFELAKHMMKTLFLDKNRLKLGVQKQYTKSNY